MSFSTFQPVNLSTFLNQPTFAALTCTTKPHIYSVFAFKQVGEVVWLNQGL
jgi:hypothetical protein